MYTLALLKDIDQAKKRFLECNYQYFKFIYICVEDTSGRYKFVFLIIELIKQY